MRGIRRATSRAALALLVCCCGTAAAQPADTVPGPEAAAPEKLKVGIKVAPPFVLKDPDGTFRGISVDLWKEVALRLDLDYEFEEHSLEDLLDGVESGRVDVGVAALTVTPDREKSFDFSHPFYTSGLGIAVVPESQSGWLAALKGFFSLRMLKVVGGLAGVLLLAGFLVWLFERKRNPGEFAEGRAGGLGAAFWWSAVTMTTVGYGDMAPRTAGGRGIALVWMFTSVIIISSFTAAIASALTVGQLKFPVEGPGDLPGVRVGTVAASTSVDYLELHEIDHSTFDEPRAAMRALIDGEIDAVVYDAPILRHLAGKVFQGKARVLRNTFERQDYAFALKDGSALREPVNQKLLDRITSPWWRDQITAYLGSQ
ncbi:MAG: transporter substrate-binding domain-containing protein [Myxococcota bacterium]